MQSNRILLFLDVLGFSELVARQDFGELFDAYLSVIKETVDKINPKIKYVVFSDSIVVVSPEDNDSDLTDLVEVMGIISYRFLVEQNLPIKGCITSGKVTYKAVGKDVVIAGSPIVEAYRYEQKMDWVGGMISPNTARKYPFISSHLVVDSVRHVNEKEAKAVVKHMGWNIAVQRYFGIPLKGSKEEEHFEGFCIVPHQQTSIEASHVIEDLNRYHEALDELLLYAPEPGAQRKYKNTKLFISEVRSRWYKFWQSDIYRKEAWMCHEKHEGDTVSRTQLPPERKHA